jgi:iron complex outermembrane receptor protein
MHHATFRRSVLSAAVALLAAGQVHSQAMAPTAAASGVETQEVVVRASADASAGGLKAPYAGGQVAHGGRVGVLGSQDVMDTPFNITNYTAKLIQDQQALSIADVLQNDPAVRVARGFGNYQQAYLVRGLVIFSDDISYNGLYGLLPRQYLASELVERVEVLRGASAFLNGAAPGGSGLGGAINIAPKRAGNAAQAEFTLGVDGGRVSEAADIGRRFGEQNNLGLRVNVVHRDGDTAVHGENGKLDAALLGADYHLGYLRLSADFGSQDHRMNAATPNINVSGAVPRAPDPRNQIAQHWTYAHERDTFGTLRAEYDLLPGLTAWAAGGFRDSHEDSQLSGVIVDGITAAETAYAQLNSRKDSIKTGEVGLRDTFTTGPVKHTIVGSAGWFQSVSKDAYVFSDFGGTNVGTLYDTTQVALPVENVFPGGTPAAPLTTARVITSSLALADTLALWNDRVLLTLGGRRQKIASTSYDPTSGAATSAPSTASRITPVAGLVFKVDKQVSLYATYIEGLVAGDVAPKTTTITTTGEQGHQMPQVVHVTNGGQAFKPYQTRQGEIGVKVDTGSYGGTVSVFESRKPTYALLGTTFGESARQTNKGAELSVYGEAMPGVRALGGASFLKTDLLGKDALGSPKSQYNLTLDFDVPALMGLAWYLRGVHTARQYADAANTLVVPTWTRFDVGTRYAMDVGSHEVTLRAAVNNLAGRRYWASSGGYPGQGYLVLGAPRTFSFSATMGF